MTDLEKLTNLLTHTLGIHNTSKVNWDNTYNLYLIGKDGPYSLKFDEDGNWLDQEPEKLLGSVSVPIPEGFFS